MRKKSFMRCLAIGLVALIAFSGATMLLWNALMPTILGAPTIGFLQALGLLILTRLLFGGFGKIHHGMHMRHHAMHMQAHGMDPEMGGCHGGIREKWAGMSDEDRKAFVAKMHKKFHGFGFCDNEKNKEEKTEDK